MEPEEQKRLQFVFKMYSANHVIDAVDCIDAMYGMELAPTRALMLETIGTNERKKKFLTYNEFVDVYKRLKANPDQGCFEDFVECLKAFDLKEDGTMKFTDLIFLLKNLGETLDEKELDTILDECMLEDEDDDGNVPYMHFVIDLFQDQESENKQ